MLYHFYFILYIMGASVVQWLMCWTTAPAVLDYLVLIRSQGNGNPCLLTELALKCRSRICMRESMSAHNGQDNFSERQRRSLCLQQMMMMMIVYYDLNFLYVYMFLGIGFTYQFVASTLTRCLLLQVGYKLVSSIYQKLLTFIRYT